MRALLSLKGVLPYIFLIFFNTIVDLGDKILLQNTIFKIYDGSTQIILTAFVNALVILPAVMFFSPSGYLSDRFSKAEVMRKSSVAALIITLFIVGAFYAGAFEFALFMTFILAAQSAVFSPAKYGIIKEMFGKDRLTEGNGAAQAVTIVAILLASVFFSILFESFLPETFSTTEEVMSSVAPITFLLVLFALLEVWLSRKIPETYEGDKSLRFNRQKYLKFGYLKENIGIIFSNRVILESIISLSILFGISQVVLAVFGVHLEETAEEKNTIVAQAIMAMAGLGMAIGAVITAKLSKNYIETGLLPIGTVGMTFSIFFITSTFCPYILGLEFLSYGVFAGFLIVVLNSIIQYRAKENEMGRVMAANNFVQNIFMIFFLLMTMGSSLFDISTSSIFTFLFVLLLLLSIYSVVTLPQFLLRFLMKIILSGRYNFMIEGTKNFPKDGAALLLGNHISWIDWAVLAIASPRRISFVMTRDIYENRYLNWIFRLFDVIAISPKASNQSFKAIQEKLEEGKIVALFPEGAISRNGHLGEFKRGFEIVAKKVDAPIIPFYIRGLWGSRFSYATDKFKENVKIRERDVTVTFGTQMTNDSRASEVKQKVFELQTHSWHAYASSLKTLPSAWLKQALFEGNRLSVVDATGAKLSNTKLIGVVKEFSRLISLRSGEEQNIGILLPSSVGSVITNLSVLTLGKTVVNLNYTANAESIRHSLELAEVTSVYTSKQFMKKVKEKGFVIEEAFENVTLYYLEDIKKEVSKFNVIFNLLLAKLLPFSLLDRVLITKRNMDDTAAIVFSSGSEGIPKGIELTHKNLMGNIKQFSNLLNFKKDDVMVSSLPPFHSFGLTVSTLAPLIEGVPLVSHPDPTDAEGVGKLVYSYGGTIMFGTSTFYRIYTKNRKLLPMMFESLRFVVAGAEKLSQEVRESFKEKFGHDILEGYGATETTPVASCNIPDILNPKDWHLQIGKKKGSVGMAVPGSTFKIVDPDTFEPLKEGEEGMILIGGTQVMKGYLKNSEKTKEVLKKIDGITWYVTGDKGRLDGDGFLTIVDRYSRFAKIGGEMVSLTTVEEEIRKVIPEEVEIIATNTPDTKKGEKIVLLYHGNIDVKELKSLIRESKLNTLMIPQDYFSLETLPKLGSGKTDIKKAKTLALELCKKS